MSPNQTSECLFMKSSERGAPARTVERCRCVWGCVRSRRSCFIDRSKSGVIECTCTARRERRRVFPGRPDLSRFIYSKGTTVLVNNRAAVGTREGLNLRFVLGALKIFTLSGASGETQLKTKCEHLQNQGFYNLYHFFRNVTEHKTTGL